MKKQNTMRAAYALAVLTLLSSVLVSGTMAKYASEASGKSEARVALWSVKAGADGKTKAVSDITGNNTMAFNLFNTIYDTAGGIESEDHVKSKGDDAVIAPGTWGYVNLYIANDSEVAAECNVSFEVNAAGVPLEYAVINAAETRTDPLAPESGWMKSLKTQSSVLKANNGNQQYCIYWRWPYEDSGNVDGNKTDTAVGIAGTAAPSVKAIVAAAQID